jgi:hypothetical protein
MEQRCSGAWIGVAAAATFLRLRCHCWQNAGPVLWQAVRCPRQALIACILNVYLLCVVSSGAAAIYYCWPFVAASTLAASLLVLLPFIAASFRGCCVLLLFAFAGLQHVCIFFEEGVQGQG